MDRFLLENAAIPVDKLRTQPGAILDRVSREQRPLIITRRGRVAAVLLSPSCYDRLVSSREPDRREDARFDALEVADRIRERLAARNSSSDSTELVREDRDR